MSRRHVNRKRLQKSIAKKRIHRLFRLAEEYALCDRLNLSDRYVFLARKISMRYLVPIPKEFKRRFCKHCYSYLLPTVTCRVRINKGIITIYCYRCQKFTRIPIWNHLKETKRRAKGKDDVIS